MVVLLYMYDLLACLLDILHSFQFLPLISETERIETSFVEGTDANCDTDIGRCAEDGFVSGLSERANGWGRRS